MTNRTAIAVVSTTLLLLATAGAEADAKLKLRVTPNISSAPSTVIVRVNVPRDSDNRLLFIGADSGTFYRSSEIQLDGDRAPQITEVRLTNLPSGEYTVVAVLSDQMGRHTTVKQDVLVLSRTGQR